MGHKPDQLARKKRREREEKKSRENDFRGKARAASKEARSLYDACLLEIRAAKRRGERMAAVAAAGSDEDRAAALALLNHPHNGFSTHVKPGGESPGGADYGAAPSSIVVTW